MIATINPTNFFLLLFTRTIVNGKLPAMSRMKLAAVSLTLLLASCTYETPGPPVEDAVGVTVDSARVTVLDAGQGDKQVLSYRDIGKKQEVDYTLEEGFSQDLMQKSAVEGFRPANLDSARTTLPLSASVEEATQDEAQAPASRNANFLVETPEYSEGDISSAEGFQFGWRAEDDGQVSSLRLAAPQDADDDARSVTEQAIVHLASLPVIFPEEEIGEGARWTVESRVAGETAVIQTTTYTLDSFKDGVAQLSLDIEQRPTVGALAMEEEELEVLDTKSESSGQLTVNVNEPLPNDGHLEVTTQVIYGTEGDDLRVVQSTQTRLEFAS